MRQRLMDYRYNAEFIHEMQYVTKKNDVKKQIIYDGIFKPLYL